MVVRAQVSTYRKQYTLIEYVTWIANSGILECGKNSWRQRRLGRRIWGPFIFLDYQNQS